jgi:hypothetical protein
MCHSLLELETLQLSSLKAYSEYHYRSRRCYHHCHVPGGSDDLSSQRLLAIGTDMLGGLFAALSVQQSYTGFRDKFHRQLHSPRGTGLVCAALAVVAQ